MAEMLPTGTIQSDIADYTFLHGKICDLNSEAQTLERQVIFATGAVTGLNSHPPETRRHYTEH